MRSGEKWCFSVGIYADPARAAVSRTASPKPLPEKSNRYNWAKVHGADQVAPRQISEGGTLAISAQEVTMQHAPYRMQVSTDAPGLDDDKRNEQLLLGRSLSIALIQAMGPSLIPNRDLFGPWECSVHLR